MTKITVNFFMLIFLYTSTAHALTWTILFAVRDGKVYEVTEEAIPEYEIGSQLGEVTSLANDTTGDYFGNASNHFAVGTAYFQIEGVSAEEAIAVGTEEDQWIKAVYDHEAPISWLPVRWSTVSGVLFAGIAVFMTTAVIYAVAVSKN